MRRTIVFFALLFVSIPMAARRFILEVSPSLAQSVADQYGLVLIKQIPNHDLFLVYAPDTVDASQLQSALNADPNVSSFEVGGRIAMHPEVHSSATLDQSTAGILDSLSGFSVISYFGNNVPSYYATQSATTLIGLSNAQNTYAVTGTSVVAIIDTGVDPNHPALSGSVLPGYDFIRGQSGANERLDLDQSTAGILDQSTAGILDMSNMVLVNQSTVALLDQSTAGILDSSSIPAGFGHGTMVAGIVHLVAPTAKILPYKTFGADGTALLFDIIQAIYRAVDVDGANVINMSFDIGQTNSKQLKAAVNYANSRGVLCVAAAGNNGQQLVVYPAGFANVFGVASTTTGSNPDQQSLFTNYGSVATLAAPGESIITTYPWNFYAVVSGTSFSAPFVTGTIALLQQLNPKLSFSSASNALQQATYVNSNLGWGRLDVYRALSTYAP